MEFVSNYISNLSLQIIGGIMKTIYLVRHSEPLKDKTIPNEEIPLSKNGEKLAREMSNKIFNENIE